MYDYSSDDSVARLASLVLVNLARNSHACNLIVKAGAIAPLAALLCHSFYGVAVQAARALGNLARSSNAVCNKIVSSGALAPLVALLDGSSELAEAAARALANLAAGNRARIAKINNLDAADCSRPLLHRPSWSLTTQAIDTLRILGH